MIIMNFKTYPKICYCMAQYSHCSGTPKSSSFGGWPFETSVYIQMNFIDFFIIFY